MFLHGTMSSRFWQLSESRQHWSWLRGDSKPSIQTENLSLQWQYMEISGIAKLKRLLSNTEATRVTVCDAWGKHCDLSHVSHSRLWLSILATIHIQNSCSENTLSLQSCNNVFACTVCHYTQGCFCRLACPRCYKWHRQKKEKERKKHLLVQRNITQNHILQPPERIAESLRSIHIMKLNNVALINLLNLPVSAFNHNGACYKH